MCSTGNCKICQFDKQQMRAANIELLNKMYGELTIPSNPSFFKVYSLYQWKENIPKG